MFRLMSDKIASKSKTLLAILASIGTYVCFTMATAAELSAGRKGHHEDPGPTYILPVCQIFWNSRHRRRVPLLEPLHEKSTPSSQHSKFHSYSIPSDQALNSVLRMQKDRKESRDCFCHDCHVGALREERVKL